MKAKFLYVAGISLVGVGIILAFRAHDDAPPHVAFQGKSGDLKQSIVVPTLKTAMVPEI